MNKEVVELFRKESSPEVLRDVRELWKVHSIAEDERSIDGLISTLTPDCVYEVVNTGHVWRGHDGARQFYTELLTAFPDIDFSLQDIEVGANGLYEEATVTGTHAADWLDYRASGKALEFGVVIRFPWDEERRLFKGERVFVYGLEELRKPVPSNMK